MLNRLARDIVRRFSDKLPPRGFKKFDRNWKFQKQEVNLQPKFSQKPIWKWSLGAGALYLGGIYIFKDQPQLENIKLEVLINRDICKGIVGKLVIEIPLTKQQQTIYNVKVYDQNSQVYAVVNVNNIQEFIRSIQQIKERKVPIYFSDTQHQVYSLLELESALQLCISLASYAVLASLFLLSYTKLQKFAQNNTGPQFDIFTMNKAKFKLYGAQNQKVKTRFQDVAGLNQAKNQIMEIIDFLKSPQKFQKLGARIPKGALLVGPPGTGKTLLAKATAGQAGVPFFSASGSEFIQMYVGVGASRVRDLFDQAKQKAPSIVFIDQIDAIGRKRQVRESWNDERDNTLNQLLVEMDGFETNQKVVVMAGTNRKDILDPALLRAGRFDRTIDIPLPDMKGRQSIIKIYLLPLILNPQHTNDWYSKKLAALTPGFSGADLANLCNEAAMLAARFDKRTIDYFDFQTASERIIGGLKRSKQLNEKEKSLVAYHQAGHTVAGWFLQGADPVFKVSILPRSKGALGVTQVLPNERTLLSKKELLDKICAILGGRVAQEIFFTDMTTGAFDDIKEATQIASGLVGRYGMNEQIGVVAYNLEQEHLVKPLSEQTNKLIDQEIRKVVHHCLERTRKLLTTHKEQVKQIADNLLKKERLVYDELIEILGEEPFMKRRFLDRS